MIIYLSLWTGVPGRGPGAVSTNSQSARRPTAVRDPRAHRSTGRGWLSPLVRLLSGPPGDDLAPSQGAGERGGGRVPTRWTVRVLQDASAGAGRVSARAEATIGPKRRARRVERVTHQTNGGGDVQRC